MASWPAGSKEAAEAGVLCDMDVDTKHRWEDGATNYIIRFNLPGFKKDEFTVRVDADGRLTLRGERPTGHVRVHKALQLPPTADVDRIAARFDGKVLCLTVPKVPVSAAEMARMRVDEAKEVATWETEKGRSDWDRGQVIAAAVAAFALGVLVTHKFLSAKNI